MSVLCEANTSSCEAERIEREAMNSPNWDIYSQDQQRDISGHMDVVSEMITLQIHGRGKAGTCRQTKPGRCSKYCRQ